MNTGDASGQIFVYYHNILIKLFRSWSKKVCNMITMDGERNHSMGSPMDGTPPKSEDR